MFYLIILVAIIVLLLSYIVKNKIHIKFKTFFQKGFKKLDNHFGLIVFDGKQGTGKTYSAVSYCISEKTSHNYQILTNVHSFNSFDDTLYYDDIRDIIEKAKELHKQHKPFMIFFDEIFTILEKGGSLSSDILSFISQLRKRKILFVTTAQEWAEINITFRRYCRYEVRCNMIPLPLSKTAIVINQINDAYQMRWENDSQEFVAPTIRTNISKGLKKIIQQYDTFETIKTGNIINVYGKR